MESYEDFIQRLYNSHYNNDDDDEDSQKPSSVIVFHGARVLPPLLNEQQRDEMRRLREAAMSLMKRRSEEESQISFTDMRLSDAERHAHKSDDIITSAPLTSTGRSANQLRAFPDENDPLQNSQGVGCKTHTPHDPPDDQMMMMMSSGYVTNDNTDVTCHSSWIEGAVHLDTAQRNSTGSDIISHAPVDGAFLEENEVVKNVTEPENPQSDPDEGPYPMSLQNLLKKSQEYRRRQREARALKPTPDEHSLSDKENEELLPKHTCKTEPWKTREKRKENTDHMIKHAKATSTSLPVKSESLFASKPTLVRISGSKRFTNIPTPKFCLSPVRCVKKSSGIPGPVRKTLSESESDPNISMNKAGMMSEQTEQIAQLELNLSSLKALISDLESTLTLSQKHPSTVTVSQTLRLEDCGIGQENSNSIQTSHSIVGALNHSGKTSADEAESSLIGSSYDVDAPSSLWMQLTPETRGQEVVSQVKRRLLMNECEAFSPGRDRSSTPRVRSSSVQEDHVTALMEEERRQQHEHLQSLAVRFQFLRSVSFTCPSAGSRLEDTTTSSVCTHTGLTHSRGCVCVSLPALARGFLTRRLLRTERVSRIITTIKDTQMFLLAFPRQTAGAGRLDLMLQERVTLQLRAARHELHQICFSSSVCERMLMIRCDRELSRDRPIRTHDQHAQGFLSAATRKALERKKRLMLQRSADRKKVSPSAEEEWNLVPKMCRVSRRVSAR
ncbi:centriolar coiled-coil protein of 110 kDa [Pimephales promelas]|uniref:centriolar coiled-coil protein of 110 kDa n=1 Tax=Pimephales promelas TaxID=90988 RepID=UPI0019556DFB|nr:centriolar coiled-coil protein of 110 kDa [Pimephales promelas]KAG1950259.1 centriolar coiled-coil protein of 110 kDa [Pimephales promelas]KAG1950260.1 centriolar coiled-coil protein of 110 kDa [Pimephales promelas]